MLNYAAVVSLKNRVSGPAQAASASIRKMTGEMQQASSRVKGLQRLQLGVSASYNKLAMASRMASRVSAVTGLSVIGAATNATRITAKYEDLSAVLETLEGSSAKAQKSLAWVKKFTRETPFGLEATATAFARLKAYGMDPTDGTLRIMGDTAAALGKDVMAAVEMMADAVVGENERLKEFGIRGSVIKGKKGATDQIEYTYKNKAGEQQTLRVNKMDQDAIRKALNQIFDEKYGGAMEKRSKTFNGILANLGDTLAEIQNQFMDSGMFKRLKDSAQSKLDALTKLAASGQVANWGKRFVGYYDTVSTALSRVKAVMIAVISRVAELAGGWKNLAAAVGSLFAWWALKDAIIGIVSSISLFHVGIAATTGLLSRWQQLIPYVTQAFPVLGTWLGKQIPAAIQRFSIAAGTLKQIWQGNEYWGGNRLQQFRNLFIIAFKVDPIKKYGQVVSWLSGIWKHASSQIGSMLPRLFSASKKTFTAIGQWMKSAAGDLKAIFGTLAVLALQRLTLLMERLSVMASNGSLQRWLNGTASKITPVVSGISQFATGLWKAIKGIAIFIGRFAKFVGGWENFAKVIVGAGIIHLLSGFLQGLGAIGVIVGGLLTPLGLLAAGIAVVAGGAWYLYQNWESLSNTAKILGSAVLGLIGTLVLYRLAVKAAAIAQAVWAVAIAITTLAMRGLRAVGMLAFLASLMTRTALAGLAQKAWTALLVAGRLALLLFRGALILFSGPIGWIIAAVAAAIALWKNWDKVIAYLKEHFPGLYKFFAETLPAGLNKTIEKIKNVLEWLGLVSKESAKLDITAGLAQKAVKTVETVQTVKGTVAVGQVMLDKAGGWEGIKGRFTGAVETIKTKAAEARQKAAEQGVSESHKVSEKVSTLRTKAVETRQKTEAHTVQKTSKIAPVESMRSSINNFFGNLKGQHELTLNLKAAPGVSYSIENQKTTGSASKFNLGNQAGADR